MISYLEEILKQLDWKDGFQIPVANADNRALEEEVARLTLHKIKTKTACETASVKLENLTKHLKHVQDELVENQKILTAYGQQLKAEGNQFQLLTGEKNKCEQEIRQFDKEKKEAGERKDLKKQHLQRCVHKLEKLKVEMNWDSEALKAWEEALQKRDQDNELIKKFSKEDERRYKELDAKRQSLDTEVAGRKQTLGKMVADVTNYEMILERTGRIMKEQTVERDALIQQWKEAVAILHQRDNDIERMQKEIEDVHELIEKQKNVLDEQNHFYENEIKNNKQLEQETHDLNIVNSRRRRELIDLVLHVQLLNGEVDTLRRMMVSTARQLERERGIGKSLIKEIELKERRIEKYAKEIDELRMKLAELNKSSTSAAARSQELEKMIKLEEKLSIAMMNENQSMQTHLFRIQQELAELVSTGKALDNSISGLTTGIGHLRKRGKDAQSDLERQKEIVYQMDFKIDELQRQIFQKEKPQISPDENIEEETKLNELQKKMDELTEIKNMLNSQVNKIREDMRRLTSAVSDDQGLYLALKDKLQHQTMSLEGGQKQIKLVKLQLQEAQVEENVLRLRVNYLVKVMKKEEHSICNLQKFRLTLEQEMTEHSMEINFNKEVLITKRRTLNEDIGRMRGDYVERGLKIDHLRKKYEVVVMSFGTDEAGQPLSVTHFKIRNAQEKFLLQEEGDQLDGKIKKAEKEIVAMENTLKLVNATNAAFKKSLGAVEDHDEEMNEMKILNEELMKLTDVMRSYRLELTEKKAKLADKRNSLEELKNKKTDENQMLEAVENEYVRFEQDTLAKDEKLQRTEKCLKRVSRKLSSTEIEKYDRNLEIRQIREANNSVKQRLVEMSTRYQEIAPLINRYAIEYNVRLPEKPSLSSSSSSRSASCQSVSSSKSKAGSVKSESAGSSKSSSISTVVLNFHV